jgi:hypothetical protein
MYYLVNVDHNAMAAHLTRSEREELISTAIDGTHDDSCGMAVKRMGMLEVSVRKMKALTVTVMIETD